MHELDKIIDTCRALMQSEQRGILVTIIRTQGSTYRRAGARAVIAESGEACGAISGGCLERDLAERIAPWLADMQARLVHYDSTRPDDLVFGLGLGCRGVLELLIEPFDAAHPPRLVREFSWNGRELVEWTTTLPNGEVMVELIKPQRAIAIFGGSADAEPVAQLARAIGWRAEVITSRAPIDPAGYDAAVIMTHNFLRDVEILQHLSSSSLAYIGILGPRSRGDELFAQAGIERDARIHNPIGLDLGSETPEEIALSIVAEVQAVLARRSARALRDVNAPIHDPVSSPTCV